MSTSPQIADIASTLHQAASNLSMVGLLVNHPNDRAAMLALTRGVLLSLAEQLEVARLEIVAAQS